MNETTSPSRSQPEDPRLRAEFPAVYEPDFLSVVDSVQAEVIRRADAGAGEGLLIWAAEQTHGRGQHGPWDSPAGGCTVPFCWNRIFPRTGGRRSDWSPHWRWEPPRRNCCRR